MYEENQTHSNEAEMALLGAILTDPACLYEIQSDGFKTEYFFAPAHKAIYAAMISIDSEGKTVDPLLILDYLKSEKVFDDAAGKKYLLELADSVPTSKNVLNYAKIIREKYYIRALVNVSREITETATSGNLSADMVLDSAEQKIYDIRKGKENTSALKLSEIIRDQVIDRLGKLNSDEREEYLGIKSGFSDLDSSIIGFSKSDLVIVGARPAMGKTSFALNIARNMSVIYGKKVLFFSLEMTKEQLASRVIATEARIEGTKMRSGRLDQSDWERLTIAAKKLSECNLYFDDSSNITVPEMKAKIRRLKDVDCVIIDYLQLMKSGTRTENRVQEVSEITRSLKLMAKDLNVPVITLAQLARGTEARGKSHRPQLSDLRESGSTEQDADIVFMLYREDYYADEENPSVEKQVDSVDIIISKNRHGPTRTVKLAWNPDYTLFSTFEKDHDEEEY